jgi:hypothetical protein
MSYPSISEDDVFQCMIKVKVAVWTFQVDKRIGIPREKTRGRGLYLFPASGSQQHAISHSDPQGGNRETLLHHKNLAAHIILVPWADN